MRRNKYVIQYEAGGVNNTLTLSIDLVNYILPNEILTTILNLTISEHNKTFDSQIEMGNIRINFLSLLDSHILY